MKSLLISATLLLAFAVFVNGKPHHPHPLPPHKQAAKDACLKKLGLTDEQLHQHKERTEENKKEHSCFKACIDKELGIINAEGNIDKEAALKDFPPFVPEANRTTIVEACFEKKGADDCETADLFHSCMKKFFPRPPMHPELQKAHDSCKEKLSLTDEEIEKSMHSRDEVKTDCFLACVGTTVGFLNEDESLNKEAFLEKLPPHIVKEDAVKIADECAKEVGTEKCESAVLLHKCFKKNKIRPGQFYGPPPPRSDEE